MEISSILAEAVND